MSADLHVSQRPFWPRAIVLVDMNAFFASIEQLDRPDWRARPVAVTNGLAGTCVITCSYEARRYGVHTGMRIREARRLCPELIQCPARPERYAAVSTRIMQALEEITPDVEVFSVDEAFLDVTRCQRLWGPPETIARLVRRKVRAASGLGCSVGVSGDKSTAKFAAKLDKPEGLTLIPPWEAAARLRDVPVTELSGVKAGIGGYLAQHGARTCGEVARLPVSVLARRFGNPGRRIWYMCQGLDPEPVRTTVAAPGSLGHGKVVPPDTRDAGLLRTYLLHMCEKVAARLRRHDLEAQVYAIGLRARPGWLGGRMRTATATQDSRPLQALCRRVMEECWRGEGIFQVQVTALDPRPARRQGELFAAVSPKRDDLSRAMDAINRRFGEFALAPGWLLNRSTMPNVIAPAWKPFGHRQTI
jgi:DNA polymerase-4